MSRKLDLRDVRPLAIAALERGAEAVRPGVIHWDVSGRCQSPRYVERHASRRSEPDEFHHVMNWRKHVPMTVEIEVKCRRCTACLRARARYWAQRCQYEISRSSRTWFGTLTLSPHNHYLMLARAQHLLAGRGVSFEGLSPPEQFAERHAQISQEITLWVKRIRKNSGAKLRLFLVAEAHKSGLPHYHMLVHESGVPVSHKILSDAWRLGFTRFKLVDTDTDARKTSWYVCKYLTKSASAKIRASTHYGKQMTISDHILDSSRSFGVETTETRNKSENIPPRAGEGEEHPNARM